MMPKLKPLSYLMVNFITLGLVLAAFVVAPPTASASPNAAVSNTANVANAPVSTLQSGPTAFAAPATQADTHLTAADVATTTASPNTVKPHYLARYYANNTSDSNGSAANCTNSNNTDCRIRDAISLATNDGHGNNQDLILINGNQTYTLSSALPALPTYLDFGTGSYYGLGCPAIAATINASAIGSGDGLALTGNNNVEGVTINNAPGNGVTLTGPTNYIACSTANNNGSNGLVINASNNSNIGDSGFTSTNNKDNGVLVTNGSYSNNLHQMSIGSTFGGGNANAGVRVDNASHDNYVGKDLYYYGYNYIVNNGSYGILITGDGTNNNYVQRSSIGIASDNKTSAPNGLDGIRINGGAKGNKVATGYRNYINNNKGNGISIVDSGTNSNIISAADVVANVGDGIFIGNGAQNNTVDTSNDYVYSSSNSGNGLHIDGSSTTGNVLNGKNYIGTNGNTAYPNGKNGVLISNGASGNTIGSSNRIGGNTLAGIEINAANNNTITSNCIGTEGDYYGCDNGPAVPDQKQGILIDNGSQGNIIVSNLVAGNTTAGLEISDANTSSNTVQKNTFGTNNANNFQQGILIDNSASGNLIGGETSLQQGNTIQYNRTAGVEINGANSNIFRSNVIKNNRQQGVLLDNGAQKNVFGQADQSLTANPNYIQANGSDGVSVVGSTTNQNTFSRNWIDTNAGKGINLNYPAGSGIAGGSATGPNNQVAPPILYNDFQYNYNNQTLNVNGKASPNARVEIFIKDNSVNLQGGTFVGSIIADSGGNFSGLISNATNPGNYPLIATATLLTPAGYAGSTSEFALAIPHTYTYNLPLLANNANTAVGQTTTFITFQNLSSSNTANVKVQYYDIATGSSGPSDSFTLVAKGQKAILPNIPSSTSYGGIVTSDRPLNLVVSESLNSGGSAYNVSSNTSSTLYSPLALNGQYGFTTAITVFNSSSTTSTGTIQFYDETGQLNSKTTNFSIPPNASHTFRQTDADSGLTNNHAYWAKITAANATDSLSAQVIEFGPNNFVATFNALVPSQVQSTLYAPTTFNGQFGFVTGMGFANPNNAAASGNIKYYDKSGVLLLTQPVTIPANGDIGVFQPGVNGLSTTVASATITSDQPLIMTVNEIGPGSFSGTYVGLTAGSQNVALPVMAKGFAGFITGTTILNIGSVPANLTFIYLDSNGSQVGYTQSQTIGANASFQLYQGGDNQGLPSDYFGTALITSDQPLLVTTNALNGNSGLFYTYTEPN